MPESFDPYYKWLGIPSQEQPPHHYRLLGLSVFESDPDVIDAAASRQVAYLHGCATGPYFALSQKLLNEIAAARLCLINSESKAAYDADLRRALEAADQINIEKQHADSHSQQVSQLPEDDAPCPSPVAHASDSPSLDFLVGKPVQKPVAQRSSKERAARSKRRRRLAILAVEFIILCICGGIYLLLDRFAPVVTKQPAPRAAEAKPNENVAPRIPPDVAPKPKPEVNLEPEPIVEPDPQPGAKFEAGSKAKPDEQSPRDEIPKNTPPAVPEPAAPPGPPAPQQSAKEGSQKLTLTLIKKKLRGVRSFNPKTNELTLTYDFLNRRQLDDFDLNNQQPTLNNGVLLLAPAQTIRHVVKFNSVTIAGVLANKGKGTYLATTSGVRATREGNSIGIYNAHDSEQVHAAGTADVNRFALEILPASLRLHLGNGDVGKAVNSAKAGQIELCGGSSGAGFSMLVMRGEMDEQWAQEFFGLVSQ